MKSNNVASLSAILLTSANPSVTARWYEKTLGIEFQKEAHEGPTHWACETGGMHFAIHNAKSFAKYCHPIRKANATHLFFTISEIDRFLSKVKKMKLKPALPIEEVGRSKMVTLRDPDGRMVIFGTPWH